ncbi:MAG TPA: F0F1 ATP synthase subunit A [Candidatus Acidoferrales bacterium]|nr:F0F1 ATP synthase subunit A [Candidatus Acidoferrales bacterium]
MGLSATIVSSWIIMAVLVGTAIALTRHMRETPGSAQTVAEAVVMTMQRAIDDVLPRERAIVFPFVATLWIFIVAANLSGIIPGVSSPTADLSATAALAVLTFFFVHWTGVRSVGLRRYLEHYVSPNPIMLPFEIISEISRTITLAVRLFGNMMSLELAALIVVGIAGFLVPIPLLLLHIVEALIQAYIFGMLALVYVAGGIEIQRHHFEREAS